jgi:hypothetical protein
MLKKYKLMMKVPKTPKNAYDHGRFISSLIEHQIKHFSEIERSLLKPGETLTDYTKIKTELQASKYLKHMTALAHERGGRAKGAVVAPEKTSSATNAAVSKSKTKKGKRKSR